MLINPSKRLKKDKGIEKEKKDEERDKTLFAYSSVFLSHFPFTRMWAHTYYVRKQMQT